MVLSENFKEFLKLLSEHKVKYLIVGGYAVAYYGHPRYTKDLDVWVKAEPDNAKKIINALEEFGFSDLGISEKELLNEESIIQLGYPPERIDLILSASGISFDECYEKRREVEYKGVKIGFIDIENLKLNKKATGRFQDLADLENLEE